MFCVSSNFCQWGKEFKYTYYKEEHGEIFQSIKALDFLAFNILEKQEYE